MNVIKKIFRKILYKLPLKYIIFESRPDLADNTKAVFDEMLQRGVNRRNTLVWFCYDGREDYPPIKHVKYLDMTKGGFIHLLSEYYSARAKACICSNRFIYSNNPKTFNVYLNHGTPLKETSNYYEIPNVFDVFNFSSANILELRRNRLNLDAGCLKAWGFPRNDVLTQKPMDLHKFFKCDYGKIIVWYPTVRQFSGSKKKLSDSSHALPIIWDEKKAVELNNFAKDKNVLIVLKPHFAQDVSKFTRLQLSNIVFIDDSFFTKNSITSYRFVGSCDALITDYSSIYYDFTLCDKPIGLVWEDYEEYKKNPGFAVDMDYVMKGGVKIYNLDQFKDFVNDIALGKDTLRVQRREIRDYSNTYLDGSCSKRVVEIITEQAKL